MFPQCVAHQRGTILLGSPHGLVGGAKELFIENDMDCFHIVDPTPQYAPHPVSGFGAIHCAARRCGFCIGTTCTVTSRTSDRNRLSTEPRSRMFQRERTGCPNTTCEIFSCCAKRISASETLRSTSDTTCAPRSRAMRRYSSRR